MWEPDSTFMHLLACGVAVLALLVTTGLWAINRQIAGPGCWVAAAVLALAGCLLPPVVHWPRPELGLVVADSLTFAQGLLVLEGILRFQGLGSAGRRLLPLTMAGLGVVALMLITAKRPGVRLAIHDLALAATLLAGFAALVARGEGVQRVIALLVGGGFLFLAAALLWRIMPTTSPDAAVGAGPVAMFWPYGVMSLWMLLWSSGFPLLVNIRALSALRQLVEKDTLTQLAGRAAFFREATRLLAEAQVLDQRVGILLLDIDGLKQVNDTLGHEAGDGLLTIFAARLRSVITPGQLLARIDGDGFVMLAPGLPNRAALALLADRTRTALSSPALVGGSPYMLSFRIGSALCPDEGTNLDVLLELAEQAMYGHTPPRPAAA